jgi:hypothetical protein
MMKLRGASIARNSRMQSRKNLMTWKIRYCGISFLRKQVHRAEDDPGNNDVSFTLDE